MWCNQIFSLIKKETVLSITEEEFNSQVQSYMTDNSCSQEEAEDTVFNSAEKTDRYTVANICVCDNYEIANQIARNTYGEGALAVDTTLIPVTMGDTYENGKFFRNGEEVPANPTEAEEIRALDKRVTMTESTNQTTYDELTATQIALVEQYEENLAMADELTSTQLALVELYESMISAEESTTSI